MASKISKDRLDPVVTSRRRHPRLIGSPSCLWWFWRSVRLAFSLWILTVAINVLLLGGGSVAQTPASHPPAEADVIRTFAFAKASPLNVSDSLTNTESRPQDFEFGKAYEVVDQDSGYLKLKLDGRFVYVRSTLFFSTASARWLTTTSAYNHSERAHLQFWESGPRLNAFLSNADRVGSLCDYEEFFADAPTFKVSLPIVERDSVDLLERQIKLFSVLVPTSRDMSEAFEAAMAKSQQQIDLELVVDVSGSTKGFLEQTVDGVARAIQSTDELRDKIRSVVVTTFGATRSNRSTFVGRKSLAEIEKFAWHPSGLDQNTTGDREPLVDALVMMRDRSKPIGVTNEVIVVLSGADVDLVTTGPGATMSINRFELPLDNRISAIMAQITPEPGDELKIAGKEMKNGISHVSYISYSESVSENIVSELVRIEESGENNAVNEKSFGPVVTAGDNRHMMTLLPRMLTQGSSLPGHPPSSAQAEWYTTRLWLPVDDLIWEERTYR